MSYFFKKLIVICGFLSCKGSYHEQYKVPTVSTDKWESYILDDKEYIVQNFAVAWDNAKIICQGHHNGTLVILDTKEKAEFLTEALSESQFAMDSVWVGARRQSAEDPSGYRWSQGVELRRTAGDVLTSDDNKDMFRHFPVWQNRTHVPVPEGGADCVALERVHHDKPVFLDLPCLLERPFVCEREAQSRMVVNEMKTVRCRTGLYTVYDGRMNWHQAASYCVMRKMSLANIATMRCLRKLGMSMLKTRPSIENAWIGGRGNLGKWSWVDTGLSIFQTPAFTDALPGTWPPMRDRSSIKQSGCLQLDRHTSHSPLFLEARCERKMNFICYQAYNDSMLSQLYAARRDGVTALQMSPATPSDEQYYYVLVRQLLYWQHAFDNCQKMNGTLASVENSEVLIQLLLTMGENKEQPIEHIWISGRLNMSKDAASDAITYAWYNPTSGKRIPDPKSFGDAAIGLYVPPWLDDDFSTDNSCLNLDRQDHLNGLVYGLPCDTPQYSICMIEKTTKQAVVELIADGYDTTRK